MFTTWAMLTYIPAVYYVALVKLGLALKVINLTLLILDSSVAKKWVRWAYDDGVAITTTVSISIFGCMIKGYTTAAILLAVIGILQFFIWLYWVMDVPEADKEPSQP